MNTQIEEIKARVSLEHLFRTDGHQLTQKSDLKKCRCPFHNEKTPSCVVYPDNHFHCFGCGANGTVIDYVMLSRKCSIKDAIQFLLGQSITPVVAVAAPSRKMPKVPTIDAAALMGRYQRETADAQFDALADTVGLPCHAVRALAPGWSNEHKAWAFPMRDGQGGIVGIRLRNDDGQKWAVTGSRSGVFVPTTTPQDVAMICEGPTDTAAALAMGYFAIGRPSCSSNQADVGTTCIRLSIRRVIIVSDNDGPGLRGAQDLANSLQMMHKFFIPPTKDIRKLYEAGGRREFVDSSLKSTMWRKASL